MIRRAAPGEDNPDGDHAWFVGYGPVEKPTIVVSVIVEHGGHGGATAAPVAHAVLQEFFRKQGLVTVEEEAPEDKGEPTTEVPSESSIEAAP